MTALVLLLSLIHGVLTDASGAVIPGATVSLSAANFQKSVETAMDGSYSFPGLAAGDYTLNVSYPGLESFSKRVRVDQGKALQVTIQLRPEVLTQAVTVTGERDPALGLDPDESAGAVVVKDYDLDALPDNPDDLRNMLQMLAAPGTSQIVVDGFSGSQLPPKAAIKEIKINPDPFSAAYEWMGFGRVEIVTKPGAEKFHGSFGLTDSDAAFNSRNPYARNKAGYLNRMFTANAGSSFKNRASYTLNFYHNIINNTALIDAVTLDPETLADTSVRSTVVVPR